MNSAAAVAADIARPAVPAELPAHLPSLDGVRGLAIALVVLHNANMLHHSAGVASRSVEWLAGLGWIGVQLFFVLSGFLITRVLLETQGARNFLSAFYVRRALRIMPAYYSALLGVFVLWPLFGHWPAVYANDASHQVWLWLFLSNWSSAAGWGSDSLPHFWSLAVEEQFYLVWPFVVMRRSPRQVLIACAAVAAVALLVRVGLWLKHADALVAYTLTVSRMDALACGAAIAALVQMPGMLPKLVARRGQLLWAGLATLAFGKLVPHAYWMDDSFGQVIGYSILAVGFSFFVLAAACSEVAPSPVLHRVLCWRVLRVLGKYSYALYIVHPLVSAYIGVPALAAVLGSQSPGLWQSLAYVLGVALVSLALAWLSYHLIEKWFLGLKRFFVPEMPSARLASA